MNKKQVDMLKRFGTLFILLLVLVLSCTYPSKEKKYQLTAQEKKLCDSLQFDQSIIRYIRKYNKETVEAFHYSLGKFIVNGDEIEANPIFLRGIVFTEDNNSSYGLVLKLKDELKDKGYIIFLLENNFAVNNRPDYIGVLNTTDKYSVLKQVATDGINYDITNDSLLSIIKKFDRKYSLELIGASGDWCEFIIQNEPRSWMQFAQEVYDVCPDVVDQGTGSVKALAEEMEKTKRLYFWWD